MQKPVTKKSLLTVGIIYCIIIGLINYLGFLLVTTQQMPMLHNEAYLLWINYMYEHSAWVNTLSGLSFVLPALICILYACICSEESAPAKLINMPVKYSLIGSLGWIFSLLIEFIFLFILYFSTGTNMNSIAKSSALNIIQCCVFISTIAFMCLNAIHRFFVLPKFFPEGNLSQFPGAKNISTTVVITVFYISVGIFPVFYLLSTLKNYGISYHFPIVKSVYLMLAIIIVLDIVLLIALASYLGRPLKKMRKGTDDIKQGLYEKNIDVISNDDFGALADSFNDMSRSIAHKNRRIESIQNSIIKGMAVMVDSRDPSTGDHINRTSECVRIFVEKMKADPQFDLSESFVEDVIKAAPMHDLGKIAIDDAILRKPGKFTPEEFEAMKKHSVEGAKIVREVLKETDGEFKHIAENVAHFHHEKWDGNGYPTKISGEDIPLEARIMALADVFDALVSKRCYKESMDYDKAFAIIEESLGTHFDPVLGRFFISCRKDLEALYNELPE